MRIYVVTFASAMMLFLMSSCGTVRPAPDFSRAAGLIKQRTGSTAVYDPEAEGAIAEQVEARLAGGVTIDEAVEVALLNNRALQEQFLQIGISKADLVQSGLLANPTLLFSARAPQGGGRVNLTAGIAQEIAELWQIPQRKRIARDALEQTILGVTSLAIDLATRTKAEFWGLAGSRETEKTVEAGVSLYETMGQLAQRRFDAGESTMLDVNLIRANLLSERFRLETIRRESQIHRTRLLALMGVCPEMPDISFADPIPPDSPAAWCDAELVKLALDCRVDARMSAYALDSAAAEIKRQRWTWLSGLTAGVEVERPEARAAKSLPPLPWGLIDGSGATPSQVATDALIQRIEQARDRNLEERQAVNLLAGPSLQLAPPLWDLNKPQRAKSAYALEQQQKRHEELLLTIAREVCEAAAACRAASAQLKLAQDEAIPLADRNVSTAQRLYEAGEESVLTLLLAQQNRNAQYEVLAALKAEYAGAQIELERAMGGQCDAPAEEDDGAAPKEGVE